jgi:hypothetical protein
MDFFVARQRTSHYFKNVLYLPWRVHLSSVFI